MTRTIISAAITGLTTAVLLGQQTWPPPGVVRPGQSGVIAPRVIRQVTPQYTPEAMQHEIEGVVLLGCVVDANGHVADAMVLRSLDSTYGLDAAAIATAKQWEFAPATKDGVPIPIAISIQLQFTLKRPTLTWPDGFGSSAASPLSDTSSWSQQTVNGTGLQFHLSYPADWTVRQPSGSRVALVQHLMPRTAWLFEVQQRSVPRPPPQRPLPAFALRQFADGLRERFQERGASELVESGQFLLADRLWVWLDAHVTSSATVAQNSNVFAAMMRDFHIWAFVTAAQSQEILLTCSVLARRDVSDEELADEARAAQAIFGKMIRRLEIVSAPQQ